MGSLGFSPKTCGAFAIVIFSFVASLLVHAQAQKLSKPQKPPQAGTIRVNVGVVQTDVMVFDKQGHFVPDLKKEQFELRLDGKVQPIEFFEMISAGSRHDEETWTKETDMPASVTPRSVASNPNPGRTLLFFVDDLHLSADSTIRSRSALVGLLNTSMGPNDKVAVLTASGQLGSAQVLSNDKAALLASLEKLNYRSSGAEDLQYPPMTENQAHLLEQNDRRVLSYFVSAIVRRPVDLDRSLLGEREINDAIATTMKRAAALAEWSASLGEKSLVSLRNLLRSAEALPGRKIVFFLSDGFVLQTQRGDIVARIGELTTAAAHAGIVVYTLDTRGLVVGLSDAKRPDFAGLSARSGSNEDAAPMDALNALAADTGGKFLKNTNALDTALITTLAEVSRYYLLGWAIDPDKLRPGKYSTIKASIKGRSDLNVRVRQGSLDLSNLVREKK